MEPVIQYLKDNDTSITVQMSRDHNEWYWHVHSVFDDNTGGDLDEFEKPIKDLFISITSSIENIYQIGGILSITDENNLLVEYDYLIGVEKSGDKTYQL